MNSNQILVGSSYFFKDIEGFKAKDQDYVLLVDNPVGFKIVRQLSIISYDLFEWKRLTPEEFIDYALNKGPAMQLGKFLIPEFCKEIGFTIEHLKQLGPLLEKLDRKHEYEKIIYNAYIANNDFKLTNEQLMLAYESYKAARA